MQPPPQLVQTLVLCKEGQQGAGASATGSAALQFLLPLPAWALHGARVAVFCGFALQQIK